MEKYMPKGYHHLTHYQRCQIGALKESGFSHGKIAQKLKVHKSSISRELKRNSSSDKKKYQYDHAQSLAGDRRSKASQAPNKMTPALIFLIVTALRERWSPEQICGRLALEEGPSISHESIYKLVWKDKKEGGILWQCLRHRGKKYNKRKGKTSGRGLIPDRVDIDERPKIVEAKERIGDWEGDTIEGANHKGSILSLVDRKSKYTFLEALKRRQATAVTKAVSRVATQMRKGGEIHTITLDNGKEFAQHKKISKRTGAMCYFAKPYHSWERGLNEHTNGLVRQYLPKGTEFTNLQNKDVKRIQKFLNTRPRKVLGYKTPEEVFFNVPISRRVALHS